MSWCGNDCTRVSVFCCPFVTVLNVHVSICMLGRGGSSFFPRGGGGGGLTQRRCGASSTSRVAASRFFWLFWTPRKWCFPGIYTGVFLCTYHMFTWQPKGGGGGVKPYCLRLSLRQSAIGTYCVGLDILWWRFSMHIKFLLGSPRGGGGLNPLTPPPPVDPPLLGMLLSLSVWMQI